MDFHKKVNQNDEKIAKEELLSKSERYLKFNKKENNIESKSYSPPFMSKQTRNDLDKIFMF